MEKQDEIEIEKEKEKAIGRCEPFGVLPVLLGIFPVYYFIILDLFHYVLKFLSTALVWLRGSGHQTAIIPANHFDNIHDRLPYFFYT